MSLEELKEVEASTIPVGKLLYIIGKGYLKYVNHNISEFGINTTQLHLLFEISDSSDINRNRLPPDATSTRVLSPDQSESSKRWGWSKDRLTRTTEGRTSYH